MASNALNAVVSRGLATKQGNAPREIFTIDLEALASKAAKMEKR